VRWQRNGDQWRQEELDAVSFVPLLGVLG
jgi:hypothetical protein